MKLQMKKHALVFLLLAAGCGKGMDGAGSEASKAPAVLPTTRTMIETQEGTSYTGYGSMLNIEMVLDQPLLTLGIGGHQLDGKGIPIERLQWSADAYPSVAEAQSGDFIVRIGNTTGQEVSTAQVSTQVVLPPDNSVEGIMATSGTLAIKLGPGTISGQATTLPGSLSATFHGDLFVQCTVAYADLPTAATQGASVGGGGVQMVGDVNFVTPKCQPFAKWRPAKTP